MAKTFNTLITNVANEVKDTSTQMKDIIKEYVNSRYFQIIETTNLEIYNDDYTVTTSAGTAKYALPSDFGKELYAREQGNDTKLDRISLFRLYEDYADTIDENGTIVRYAVFTDDSNAKQIQFHQVPNATLTINLPYLVKPAAMTAEDDEPLANLDEVIEIGAKADAWRYKRQFGKARDFEALYERRLSLMQFNLDNQMTGGQDFYSDWQNYDGDSLV